MQPWKELEFTVRHSEGDRNGRLKLRALADYFQEIAARHADELGVGIHYLRGEGKAWVLARLGIRIERYPEIGENLTLLTYPRGAEQNLFARREYRLRDAAGNPVAAASSYWLLLGGPRLRPERMSTLADRLPLNPERDTAFAGLDKFEADFGETLWSEPIGESRIDVNGHLNNAEYFNFVADALHRLNASGPVGEVRINFLHAVPAGAAVVCSGKIDGDRFAVAGAIAGGATAFQAVGGFLNSAVF